MESQPHPPLLLETEARCREVLAAARHWGGAVVLGSWGVGELRKRGRRGAGGPKLANECRPGEFHIDSEPRSRSICRSQRASCMNQRLDDIRRDQY